jgi:hypothetical protein
MALLLHGKYFFARRIHRLWADWELWRDRLCLS